MSTPPTSYAAAATDPYPPQAGRSAPLSFDDIQRAIIAIEEQPFLPAPGPMLVPGWALRKYGSYQGIVDAAVAEFRAAATAREVRLAAKPGRLRRMHGLYRHKRSGW